MLDLMQRDLRQVGVVLDLRVALGQLRRRHGQKLFVLPGLVAHDQNADDLTAHHRARNDRARIGDDDVAGVAVFGQCMRNEAVIAGIAHRGIEESVDEQRAGGLVQLIFDRLAADRDLDHDIDFKRGIFADGNCVKAHGGLPGCLGWFITAVRAAAAATLFWAKTPVECKRRIDNPGESAGQDNRIPSTRPRRCLSAFQGGVMRQARLSFKSEPS